MSTCPWSPSAWTSAKHWPARARLFISPSTWVPPSPSPWTPGVRQWRALWKRRRAPLLRGEMPGAEKNFSARRGKPLHLWTQQWNRLLLPCFPVTIVTTQMFLKRGWGNIWGWKSQLETQLQSSSLPPPEVFRKPTSYSDALAVSPVGDSTRVIPCNNCDEDMSPNHICSTHSCGGCDEVFSSDKELTDHERAVHPNMCHVCFKVFVDENSFLTHFRQEHMNYWFLLKCTVSSFICCQQRLW